MSYISSKVQIAQHMKKISKNINMDELSVFTTIHISNALNQSRTLTSQYLNELVKEETVIKISSRPVYYFDRKELEKKYHVEFQQIEFLSVREFFKALQENSPTLLDFQKAIGAEGSLQYGISQIKSALLYPDGGLPVLLYGEKGCGKSYLVRLCHEFCINHGLSDNKANFIKMKVMKTSDGTSYKKELFGSYDEKSNELIKGTIERADGGILYIQDVDYLSEDCQEQLADYVKSGKIVRDSEKKIVVECNTRIIMSCHDDPQNLLSQSLLLNVPVICNIPPLRNRNDDEKKSFIIKFFREEQEHLDLPIYMQERLLSLLLEYEFENNINELKKCITTICANAYVEAKNEPQLNVYMYHLPVEILRTVNVALSRKEDEGMFRVDLLEQHTNNDQVMNMWNLLLEVYKKNADSFPSFLLDGQKILRHYYDFLIFKENYSDARLSAIEKIVFDILNAVKSSRNINLPVNCGYVLTRMILSSQKNFSRYREWEIDHREEIKDALAVLHKEMLNEYILSELILKQIQSHLNITLHDMNLIFLIMNIHVYNKDIHSQDTIGIVLSHGYSTATSIADAANSLLSMYLFEAIDMPLDTSIQEVNDKLNAFISDNRHIKNIILLVDMGSLEDIGSEIAGSVNVGVINNISTSLALNIGTKILQHYELEEILKVACEEAQCHYKVLSVAKKEKAIVFTNDAGVVVAEKLSSLFRKSLPKSIELKMIEYDYDELLKHGDNDILFRTYDVVLMIKPYHLKLKNVKSVTLEEIMNFKDIDIVNHVLREYLNPEEIEQFDQVLLKNFSLQSVMENITILNAQTLLDHVSDSMNALQHIMNRKFQSKTIVGIYIHICFLVERLVTKTALENYKELHDFEKNHQTFIENVNRSFDAMLCHYHVKMPVSEIAYLYEYIEHDDVGGQGEDEF